MSKSRICDYCGKRYTYSRSTSRFCSGSCRVGHHTQGDIIQQKLDEYYALLDWMQKRGKNDPHAAKLLNDNMPLMGRTLQTLDDEMMRNASRFMKHGYYD